MSHACVHLNYKRNLLKKADGLRKRKHGLISPLTWPIFDGKAVFNERNIQVLLDKNYRPLLDSLGYPNNIGGKGLGKHDSLAKRIARDLSVETKNNLQFDIEIAFFCIYELEQFSFRDEEHILREPSNNCFSMFRYRNCKQDIN